MIRTRQESAEFYEVSGAEIAAALGIWSTAADEVTLTHQHEDKYRLVIRYGENQALEVRAPDNRERAVAVDPDYFPALEGEDERSL